MTGAEKAARARAGKARKAKQREKDRRRELRDQLRLAERTVAQSTRTYLRMDDHSTDQAVTLQARILGASRMARYYREKLTQ